jgi:hypothetical protein
MTVKIQVKGISETLAQIQKEFDKEESAQFQLENIKLVNALKEETPVDTGEAQSGWQLVNGAKKAKIVNTVEHIEALNNGHSEQAPSYFIEKTALRFGKPEGPIVTPIPSAK